MKRCRICGCTDRNACDGGCEWVRDPEVLRGALCSRCLPLVEIELALRAAMRRDRSLGIAELLTRVLPSGTWTQYEDEDFGAAIVGGAARVRP